MSIRVCKEDDRTSVKAGPYPNEHIVIGKGRSHERQDNMNETRTCGVQRNVMLRKRGSVYVARKMPSKKPRTLQSSIHYYAPAYLGAAPCGLPIREAKAAFQPALQIRGLVEPLG